MPPYQADLLYSPRPEAIARREKRKDSLAMLMILFPECKKRTAQLCSSLGHGMLHPHEG